LAAAFAEHFPVVGFDINKSRIQELQSGIDRTLEVADAELEKVIVQQKHAVSVAQLATAGEDNGVDNIANSRLTAKGLYCTNELWDIADCTIYIITVPTPVDKHNRPDLTPLYKASETVGKVLKKGDIVIYESTVYPGVTEDECVPVLEKVSGLKFNTDFFCGYSPERINPGDKEHTVTKILKVTSGSTPDAAETVDS